ncbi:hypothetical protein [Deinococcus roseus]|uniref:hypothetical protein n=1 Tax=Deinococcus roseus TaxID=392414 RepID=UPI0016629D75|nr:hypothetical protein [Deinococcus roseus]
MPLNFWAFPTAFLIFICLSIHQVSIQQIARILAGNLFCFALGVVILRNLQVNTPKGHTFHLLLSMSNWLLAAMIILVVNGLQWRKMKLKGMWWSYLPSVVILQFWLLIYSSRYWWS